MTATEYEGHVQVILVNELDEPIGVAEKMIAHEQNLLHRAFSVFIFRENHGKELLIQKRALHKYHSPGLWTNTCCSHPAVGETVLAAATRRLQQELGLSVETLSYHGKFHYNAHFPNGLTENEIDHVLVATVPHDISITPNPDEVDSVRWITLSDLQHELSATPHYFTPWFNQALTLACMSS